jgi:hypothetical protein
MKKIILILLILQTFIWANAQNEEVVNLIDCEKITEWKGKLITNQKIKRSGKFSFETFGKYPTRTEFKEFIEINPFNKYKLSCYMRSLDSSKSASGYLGLLMYDKMKKLITIKNVAVLEGTESKLAKPAAKGTKIIFVEKNKNFEKYKYWVLAFNIKKDYSDLPNFDVSPRIKSITDNGDNCKFVLFEPLKKNYPIGVKIRLHSPWGAAFYWAARGWMPKTWKYFSVTLQGISKFGTPANQFWKGTKYVKPFFDFGNWDRIPPKGARLLVDDITFTKSR